MTYERLVIEALREVLTKPIGYISSTDEKYGAPLPQFFDPDFERYDPSKPAHPIFNRPPVPEQSFSDYLRAKEEARQRYREQARERRRAYLERIGAMGRDRWEQICRMRDGGLGVDRLMQLTLSRMFKSKATLAGYIGKPSIYANAFGKFLEREQGITPEQFRGFFSRSKKKPSETRPRHTLAVT